MPPTSHSRPHDGDKAGLAYWMARVPKQCSRVARKQMDAGAVHDLRVALRRCRSMADGLLELDPDPAWRAMRKAASRLFKPLGELRDIQVAAEWLRRLAPADDPVREKLLALLAQREGEAKAAAADALRRFDRKQWRQWARVLPGHSRRIPLDGRVFRHIALERWNEAHALHRRATRSRSKVALHQLRIGVKKFRYSVENFLPALHAEIGADLKRVQDLLGDVHDLDVQLPLLREMSREAGAAYDADARQRWREWISAARKERVAEYRARTRGGDSLWQQWRSKLPSGVELENASLAKLRAWASFLDPNARRSRRLSDLAAQLFDGMGAAGVNPVFLDARARRIARAGALLGNIGHSEGRRGHHKTSYRLIRAFAPPLGWSAADMLWVALVARYHRGTEPHEQHEGYALLAPEERRALTWLAAAVRLADALVGDPNGEVSRVKVESSGGIHVWATGFTAHPDWVARVREKQALLEAVSGRPVFVRPAEAPAAHTRAATA